MILSIFHDQRLGLVISPSLLPDCLGKTKSMSRINWDMVFCSKIICLFTVELFFSAHLRIDRVKIYLAVIVPSLCSFRNIDFSRYYDHMQTFAENWLNKFSLVKYLYLHLFHSQFHHMTVLHLMILFPWTIVFCTFRNYSCQTLTLNLYPQRSSADSQTMGLKRVPSLHLEFCSIFNVSVPARFLQVLKLLQSSVFLVPLPQLSGRSSLS